ncbi:MAG: hypothetical protein JRJ60_08525, partial [Deltaproteobacteria bacterium]|nr:hypothetical protein [Deltaproteobacteria bacterium]
MKRNHNRILKYANLFILSLFLAITITCFAHAQLPTVNGRFYGDGDYSIYNLYAENPDRAKLYYYVDDSSAPQIYLYAALVLSHNVNDNVFGEKNCNTGGGNPGLDATYLGTADTGDPDTVAWCPGPGHSFNDLVKSDHSEWNLFCGGSHWQWFQDLLYAVDGSGNEIKPKDIPDNPSGVSDWLSDSAGSDGGGSPPTSLLESASSIQWNMKNSTWDVSGGGLRIYADWKSLDNTYGTPGTNQSVTDDGYQDTTPPYFWAENRGPGSDADWEWLVVYEVKLDITDCGGVPFTLWPVTGHNSPVKDDLGENVPFYDWGDLPDTGSGTGTGNYETLSANGGPSHELTVGLFMGDLVDADSDGRPGGNADGDDTFPVGFTDDEDGVTVSDLTNMNPGDPAVVHVVATHTVVYEDEDGNPLPSVPATLYGWIDFNGDGVLSVGESASVTVPHGSDKVTFELNFGNVPSSGTDPSTYARFRLTTDTNITTSTPNGPAADGEVEDYPVTIGGTVEQRDFGDAPNTYGTTLAANGARHTISSGFHMGPAIDAETDGQPGVNANGDDLNGATPDDEDGVSITPPLQPGSSSNTLSIGLSGSGLSGKVDAWIDFNGNGVFDSGEHLNGGTSWDVSSGSNNFSYSIPADAVPGTTYARFRLSSAGSLAPTGSAADGEVEDYKVTIDDNPDIDIEKATNDEDADDPPGPNVPVGSTVTWTYVVTNTGNVTLYDLVVTDDKITNDASEIDCGGGNNTIASLAPQADQTCTATGTAVDTSGMTDGAYENTGSVVGW